MTHMDVQMQAEATVPAANSNETMQRSKGVAGAGALLVSAVSSLMLKHGGKPIWSRKSVCSV